MKYLSQEQVNQYHKDGYTVVKNLLSDEELANAKKAIEELKQKFKNAVASGESTEDFEAQTTDGELVLNRVRFPSEQHTYFDYLQKHPKLLDCIQDLLGDSIRYIAQDKVNLKPKGGGSAIKWHQDWAFFPHTNDSVVTACVLLDDVTRENACLQVVRGTHKGPVLSHYYEGRFAQVITNPEYRPENIAYLEAPAGSVSIHNARAVHGSARNTSDKSRNVACFIYTAADAWPLLGVGWRDFGNAGPVDFDKFISTMVRGDPCMTPRMESVPVNLPVPFNAKTSVLKSDFPTAPEPLP